MRHVHLNGLRMKNREKAYRHIKRRLHLPDYCGDNLDALSDCLSELPAAEITLHCAAAMRAGLGADYAQKLLSVLVAATGENPRLHVCVRERR